MAVYLVQKTVEERRGVERERYVFLRDGEYVTGIDKPRIISTDAYRMAALSVRANFINRIGDAEPKFAANANEQECVAFAEMLNA